MRRDRTAFTTLVLLILATPLTPVQAQWVRDIDEVRAAMKAACTAAKLIEEGGCSCWRSGNEGKITYSVSCGGKSFSWEVPGSWVGFDRNYTCEDLLKEMEEILEKLDQERALSLPVYDVETTSGVGEGERTSWDWPASFFDDENGDPLHKRIQPGAVKGKALPRSEKWVEDSGIFQRLKKGQPLKAGDVVIFHGTRPAGPGKTSHSGIATGRDDEISHLWWNRNIQKGIRARLANGESADLPVNQQGPGDYVVTRDKISELQKRFTIEDKKTKKKTMYYFGDYEMWRVTDERRANFDELCP